MPGQPRPSERAAAWSLAEIDTALARCEKVLDGVKGKFVMEPPLRKALCGAPAPVHVSSLGAETIVTFTPAILVTCPVVAALHRWLNEQVQPAARASFGASITKLQMFGSYDCRGRNGDSTAKLSEHAGANAVDIAAFVTADGKRIDVLTHWGAKVRVARSAAQGVRGAKKQTATAAAPVETETAVMQPTQAGKRRTPKKRSGQAIVPASKTQTAAAPPAKVQVAEKMLPEKTDPAAAPEPTTEEAFLRQIHHAACGTFGTVLGPDANEAHWNHFHLDLASRRRQNYCR